MTKPLTIATAFIGTLALFYLFGAFVAWDWDAGSWKQPERFFLGLAGFVTATVVAANTGIRHD